MPRDPRLPGVSERDARVDMLVAIAEFFRVATAVLRPCVDLVARETAAHLKARRGIKPQAPQP